MKRRIAVMLGFKGFRNVAITIAGMELMHRIRKRQFGLGRLGVQGRGAPAIWDAVIVGIELPMVANVVQAIVEEPCLGR